MNNHQIVKPVFVIGSERSGTTLAYDLLARHSDFAWFSNWTNLFPSVPQLALLSRLPTKNVPNFLMQRRLWPEPTMEGSEIHMCCGIYESLWEKQRVLGEDDVNAATAARFASIIDQHLRWQGRPRFCHKNVNNSMRVKYLMAIFPDAKFIHVIRNGMAVALSLSNVAFWDEMDLWWADFTPQDSGCSGKRSTGSLRFTLEKTN